MNPTDHQKQNHWLEQHRRNIHSQHGEDGVIEKALECIASVGTLDKWCVEFGAWDGKYLSNTYRVIEEKSYSAVLIEGMENKHRELSENFKDNKKIYPHLGLVGFKLEDGLDTILKNYPIPKNFDFLSIDIDGNDYHTWKSFEVYKPKLVCIEFNPTIPNEVDFVQPADPEINFGCSPLALVKLAKEKGYELIATTLNNCFFVDAKYFSAFKIADNSLDAIRTDKSRLTYIFSGYDGTVFLRGFPKLNLHNIPYDERRFQMMPKFLRGYSDTDQMKSRPVRRTLARIYKSLRKRNIV
jgi:hypothetical protein